MKKLPNKLALLLGLSAALALPGLAAADTRGKHSMKFAVQQQARDHQRHAAPQHVRHDRHDRYDRHDRHGHKARKHHGKHHNRGYRHDYNARWGYSGQHGHYHQGSYCNVNHAHGYRRINGYYMAPHLGLHFSLR